MKTRQLHFLYVGLATGRVATKRLKAEQLKIDKLPQPFSYPEGDLQIYYVLFPEYARASFLTKKKHCWKQGDLLRMLEELENQNGEESRDEPERDEPGRDAPGRDELWSQVSDSRRFDAVIYSSEFLRKIPMPEKTKNYMELPLELFMVELYQCRPFRGICISLPEGINEDKACDMAEEVMKLVRPYAPRLNHITWIGKEGTSAEILGDLLFDEFGFIMESASKPPSNTVWLDLRKEEINIFHMTFSEIKRIDRLETLKFLDTVAKNGYNTEVN